MNDNNNLQEKINGTAWKACDTLRTSIPGGDYKDYALTMLFLKYLSDTHKEEKEKAEEKYQGNKMMVERALQRSKFQLAEECTFDYLYDHRTDSDIGAKINKALEKITELNGIKLRNLFAGIDFNSEVVFGKVKEKNAILKTLLQDFNDSVLDLRPSRIGKIDIIGNCYEYLIARFAGDSGKKGGEFYTPSEVSTLMSKIVEPKENDRIYDPTCGSGSLLLKAANQVGEDKVSIYGQESNSSTYNLCRMNMFLHGVNDAHIAWGDTLANPLHLEKDDIMKFDVVVANPPFSLDKWAKGFDNTSGSEEFKMEASLDRFHRFDYGVPPKGTGDYAFVEHMIASLAPNGRMAVVLPHGALFRGASEGKIRERLVEDNLIDAVIGLPENLFYGVSIPATIVVFKKNRTNKDILFIEASREFKKGKNQNILRPEDISHIYNTYKSRVEEDKYSHIAQIEEIKKNEYNLNIKRYVDTFEEEKEINIDEVKKNIEETRIEINKLEEELKENLKEFDI